MNKVKSKNGITLIALIITIIILLILAMVTIRILMNQGIIKHAQNAVTNYNEAQNNETEYLTYAEGKMDKYAGVSGSDSETTQTGWTDNGDGTFTKDDITLKVGDYIAYDQTKDANGNEVATTSYTSYSLANATSDKNNGRTNGYTRDCTFNVNNYTGGWQVLSVKNGKLQLISARSVGTLYLRGQEGYRNSEEELNAICAIYGQGKGVVSESARSINVDDINIVTGYNPAQTGNGNPYNKGEIGEYGNEITYYWKGDNSPYYTSTNGLAGSGYNHSGGFYWHDASGLHRSPKSTTASNTETGREKITTLKSTSYRYYPYSLTTDSSTSGKQKGISTSSNEYKVIFGQYYWLASRCVDCNSSQANFSLRLVCGGYVYHITYLFCSHGSTGNPNYGIRPVVTLSSDSQIKTDGTQDGSELAKAYTIE